MKKNMSSIKGKWLSLYLEFIGWLAFVLGLVVDPISLKLMFLSAARVLP